MIVLRDLTLRRGTKAVLEGASAVINPGEKVGLVGRNGAGKSSLFALFDGSLHEDQGSVSLPAGWRLAQVAQDMPETDQAATRFVVEGDTRLLAAEQAVREADIQGDGEAMAHAYMLLQDAGAHDAVARAQALLLGLGFGVSELDRPVNSFSGGWRMRLQLARALMCPSDLLLLDEPTNHLDLDALVWLEAWLQRYTGTLLVISHDREFLDAVTRVTLHISQGRLTRYGGGYSAFEALRAEQITQQSLAFDRQQERIAHLQRFIDRFKAKATKARQAQSRVKALERMERVAPVLAEADFNFSFTEPPQMPNPMLVMRDLAVGYAGAGPRGADLTVVDGIQWSVQAGQRIGILGANGQGKSTLVKTIAGALAPLHGHLTQGKGLRIGYFAQQELDVLRPDEHPLQHMLRLAREATAYGLVDGQVTREQDLRNFLGGFSFSGDQVMQPVGSMSGGEKARLVLCMLVWQRPNLLVLDEPTNHLDLATREALAMALNGFDGTMLLVSHDRALLRAVCEDFWLVGNGRLEVFDGDLDAYQRHLLELARLARGEARRASSGRENESEARQALTPATLPETGRGAEQRKVQAQRRQQLAERTKPMRQALAQTEARMSVLQAEQQRLHAVLSTQAAPLELAEAGRRLKAVETELETVEAQWLDLSLQLEAAQEGG